MEADGRSIVTWGAALGGAVQTIAVRATTLLPGGGQTRARRNALEALAAERRSASSHAEAWRVLEEAERRHTATRTGPPTPPAPPPQRRR